MINGILNVYKEKGFTSHDVVAKLRGILHQKKIGHTGTLDPDAEGVLPICLGTATKLCDMLTDKSKTYHTVFKLGVVTDTQDITGTVQEENAVVCTEQQILDTIMSFVGKYEQVPPMYSAKKVNGKKLYEYAREGKVVERKACSVIIHSIEQIEVNLEKNEISMDVSCSKGTYIRTLCHDIGQQLGCGACMLSLLRTKVSTFYIKDSLSLEKIQLLQEKGELLSYVYSPEQVLGEFSSIKVLEKGDKLLYNGNALPKNLLAPMQEVSTEQVRVYDSKGKFVAIYGWDRDKKQYKPVKMFLEQ
ncbi:tRNA pseudouridine synthase B [Clostridium sp. CAG:411]|jgi:tRNA pseudouridine55 synthase|nr:tRNA pseudouridine(55) synthase TruB [Lachnospiraceae bacterium]CDE45575.1 tRNA pseudouridine synthase B [Clostridium sp. CAG:411]